MSDCKIHQNVPRKQEMSVFYLFEYSSDMNLIENDWELVKETITKGHNFLEIVIHH